ncbi:MAG: DUF2306 domain-containing protein [Pseudomonadota bacterium]
MSLNPILPVLLPDAPLAVRVHLWSAMLAVVLGPIAIYRRRWDNIHRTAGYAWVILMVVVSLSSFFIQGLAMVGPFGPIHILSVLVLIGLYKGVRDARAGSIAAHKEQMQSLYWTAMGFAGLLTLLPGRRLNKALFGDQPELGLIVVGIGTVALAARWWFARPGRALHV